ncbi:MAG: AAA family ATPase [Solirubrobacterales bacterium]|nr:AAA family ATPase [Solirubrobacterales bacterium]
MSSGLTGDGRPQLIGRDGELGLLNAALSEIRDHGSALVQSGEAGIGKSILLDAARRRADGDGLRGLRTAGVISESELPYSGLHRLLRAVMSSMEDLPAVRRGRCARRSASVTGADHIVPASVDRQMAKQEGKSHRVQGLPTLHDRPGGLGGVAGYALDWAVEYAMTPAAA